MVERDLKENGEIVEKSGGHVRQMRAGGEGGSQQRPPMDGKQFGSPPRMAVEVKSFATPFAKAGNQFGAMETGIDIKENGEGRKVRRTCSPNACGLRRRKKRGKAGG